MLSRVTAGDSGVLFGSLATLPARTIKKLNNDEAHICLDNKNSQQLLSSVRQSSLQSADISHPELVLKKKKKNLFFNFQ